MKRLLFVLIAFWVLGSCSDDSNDTETKLEENIEGEQDSEDDSQKELLMGDWTLINVEAQSGTADLDVYGIVSYRELKVRGIDFDSNLNFSEVQNTFSSSGRYQILVQVDEGGSTGFFIDNFFGSGTWELKDEKLTTISEGDESIHEITELTDTNLKIKSNIKREFDYPDKYAMLQGVFIYTLEKNK